jgi:Family of unknown function (DUF5678)
MRKPRRQEPERRVPALDGWEGCWVAVQDGKVIAAASTSGELVPKLVEMGDTARDAIAQFVPKPSNVIVIGVG